MCDVNFNMQPSLPAKANQYGIFDLERNIGKESVLMQSERLFRTVKAAHCVFRRLNIILY